MFGKSTENSERSSAWQIFTIAVIIVMLVVVAAMRFFGLNQTNQDQNQNTTPPLTLEELLDQVIPKDTPSFLSNFGKEQLSSEALESMEIDFKSLDGQTVKGYVSKPSGDGPFVAVLVVHGAESSLRATERASQTLGEKFARQLDVVALSVDWRESELGTDDVGDVIAAVKWLQNLTANSKQPVIILGMDYGAFLAVNAAVDKAVKVAGVIAAYGYTDFWQQYQFLPAINFLAWTECDQAVQIESCLKQYNLSDNLAFDEPLLILHNTADTSVSVEQSRRLQQLIPSPQSTLIELNLETPTHDFFASTSELGFNEAWNKMQLWVEGIIAKEQMKAAVANIMDEQK